MTEGQIKDHIEDMAAEDGQYAIAWALLKCSEAQVGIARALERLGLNGAAGPMGAIELLSSELKRLADAAESAGRDE